MHPDILTFGVAGSASTLRIEPFGVFLSLGLALGVALAWRFAVRQGLELVEGARALFAALGGALIGARAFHLLGSADATSLRGAFALGQGGLSGYGALFGAALASAVALRRSQWRAAWFDIGALAVLLTVAVARLGCYLTGCDFGRAFAHNVPRWLARLTTFPRPEGPEVSPVWFFHTLRGSLNAGSLATLPLHPTALYESLGALALLGTLLALRPFQRRHGQLFALGTAAYALLRVGVEALRDEADLALVRGHSLNRWAAFASVLGLLLIVAGRARARRAAA
jgi:phosphatidylglycerol---prolipoprotein diacylglyceryl transferase